MPFGEYRYGTYGSVEESAARLSEAGSTVPIYVGTAPVNLVRGFASGEVVDTPIQINNMTEAVNKIGYSANTDNWGCFTLCEAIAAHFDNPNGNIGPIYVVNVLDPAKHAGEPVSATLTVANDRAEIDGPHIVLDSLRLERPPADALDIGYLATRADAEAAFKAKGKGPEKAPVSADQVFYYVSPEAFDSETDYLLTVTCDGKSYGVRGKHEGRPEDATIMYFSLVDGSQTDFVDGKPKGGQDGKLDLSSVTGDVEFTVHTADYAGDYDAYPTVLDTVASTVLHFDDGSSPQCYEEGVDYTLAYNPTSDKTVIASIDGALPATVEATWDTVDDEKVTTEEVIGAKTENGEYSGIHAIDLLFNMFGVFANLIAAPGFSHIPEVYRALCDEAHETNGHWNAMVFADMPIMDAEGGMVDSIPKAVKWKADNRYTNEQSMVFWPMCVDTQGRTLHIATVAMAEQMRVDNGHNGIPMEVVGNKVVPVRRQYFGEDSPNRGFDQRDSLEATRHGISTVVPWGLDWVVWGDHTAAYEHGDYSVDARDYFASTLRMLHHITNDFQREWAPYIDEPMDRNMRDTILNREREKLDALAAQGAVLGESEVLFTTDDNTTDDMLQGYFTFRVSTTPTVPLKAAIVRVTYTDAGLSTLTEGE